jgi:flagellar biosynthesis/type III secretory pathway M-ring protein FliF/YscJ
MVETLQVAGKATVFSVAISLITAGSTLIKDNFYPGLSVLVIGVVLIIIWSILVEKEARTEARKAAQEAFQKLKLEMEAKKYG